MQKVATLAALRDDRGLKVQVGEQQILLVRDGTAIRAYGALCPHVGAPLDEGAVRGGCIVCPWHKGTFRVSDGALLEPPALDGLSRYPVELDGDDILVGADRIAPPAPAVPPPDARVMVIVGAGAAGATAAAALREFGFGGRVVMIGPEAEQPFDRTALSKFVMAGQMRPDEVPPLREAGFWDAQHIERIPTDLQRLDVGERRAVLRDGSSITFDAALLATGGVPRLPDLPGRDLPGVHVLRSRQDAAAILAETRQGARVVVLGGSFIGLEVAAALREQKLDVAVVAPEAVPFGRQFGERIGHSLQHLHEAHGVRFHLGTQAARLDGGGGRVVAVDLADGQRLAADLVILGVGVRPATDILADVPLAKDGGIEVDAGMRVAGTVFAAGDIAAFPLARGGRRTRIEHWRVAQQQARVAARNMLGGNAAYEGVPFFWTYHFGKRVEYLGHAETWDDIVVEGDPEQQDFLALLVRQRRVAAVIACSRERATAMLSEPMRQPLSAAAALEIVHAA